MSKSNPLFVDSTKGAGESVGTRFELSGPVLTYGEELFARVQDGFGRDQKVAMTWEDDMYAGRIWLTHQQEISYQFIIEKDGVEIASSPARKVQASHMIIERWDLIRNAHSELAEKAVSTISAPAPEPIPAEPETFTEVFPESESFSQLIDKWGL